MIDSTPLPVVVDQGSAGTTELVVEADAGSETEKALQYAFFEARKGASPMAFQGEEILAGVEDGFDTLAKGSQVRTFPGFVPALGTDHGRLKLSDGRGELFARVALVGKQDLPSVSFAALKQFQADFSFIALGRGQLKGPGSTVGSEDGVQAHSPEVAGMAGAVPVVTDVGKSGAQRRLPASSALDRSGVDKQKVVIETGALLGKDDEQPFQDGGETAPALEVAGLSGDAGKEMRERVPCSSKETPVRGLAHDGLRDSERDDLRVGRAPSPVVPLLWQKIIGCAINEGAESVEVGVHRGLLVDGVLDTVDFGLSASNPFCAAIFVESII
jgi:hypothetical protein